MRAVLVVVLAGCGVTPSPPAHSPIVRPTPTPERPRFTQVVSEATHLLLATLPALAGGEELDGVQIVDDYLHVGHAFDDVLEELQMKRLDAVSVYRYGDESTIGLPRSQASTEPRCSRPLSRRGTLRLSPSAASVWQPGPRPGSCGIDWAG